MFKQNMGWSDRAVRLIIGMALVPVGLIALDGLEGNATYDVSRERIPERPGNVGPR